MGQKRYTTELIIGKLRQARVLAAERKRIAVIVGDPGTLE